MQLLRSMRWILMALLLSLVPASSYAGVFISVGFAPPPLPVYEQPPCPEAGLMWMPGFWAYGDYGYYWVPGAWVPAPYVGALWTPGYWGWSGGLYVFHDGYWGSRVGYYGGVNYGFGYFGFGFAGGRWHGHEFEYNTAVMRVDERRIRNTYRDRDVIDRYTVARGSRAAYNGGPGGIRYQARPEEQMAMRDRHMGRTQFQEQHDAEARRDRSSYFKFNGGRPHTPAVSRPLPGETQRTMPNNMRQGPQGSFGNRGGGGAQPESQPRSTQQARPGSQTRPYQQPSAGNQNRPMPQYRPAPESRPAPQYRPAPESRPAPQARPTPQSRPAPEARPAPREERQSKPQPKEQHQNRPDSKPQRER